MGLQVAWAIFPRKEDFHPARGAARTRTRPAWERLPRKGQSRPGPGVFPTQRQIPSDTERLPDENATCVAGAATQRRFSSGRGAPRGWDCKLRVASSLPAARTGTSSCVFLVAPPTSSYVYAIAKNVRRPWERATARARSSQCASCLPPATLAVASGRSGRAPRSRALGRIGPPITHIATRCA